METNIDAHKVKTSPEGESILELLNNVIDDTFIVISPLSGSGVIADAFKKFGLSDKTGRNLTCLIKKEAFEEKYTVATLRIEKYINIGYRLDFFIGGPAPIDAESESQIYSPDVHFGGAKNLAYIYNPDNDYVIPLGEGSVKISLASDAIIDTEGYRKQIIIDESMLVGSPDNSGIYVHDISKLEEITGKTLDEWYAIIESGEYDIILKRSDIGSQFLCPAQLVRRSYLREIIVLFELMDTDDGVYSFYINVQAGNIQFGPMIPAVYFTESNRDMLKKHDSDIKALEDGVKNTPIVKGEGAGNSAILKGETVVSGITYKNRAISQTSMAVGAATTAGLKGWYYSAIDFTNKTITLSDKPTYIRAGSTLIGGSWSSGTPNIKVNDVISLVNNSKYDLCSKVTAVNGNVITVDSLPFTELVRDEGAALAVIAGQFSDGYSLYIPERPDAGLIDFGGGAFSEGGQSTASNICAHAEGLQTHAYGQYSHAEGRETKTGYAAHAEGYLSEATGLSSHAEGYDTKAIGNASHAEGYETEALANQTHTEGNTTKAHTTCAHAEGIRTSAGNGAVIDESVYIEENGRAAHAEGAGTAASGTCSHAEGHLTASGGVASHAEGYLTEANKEYSHAEGRETKANGGNSHVEGYLSETASLYSHAEGRQTFVEGNNAHAEGWGTVASGNASHAEGNGTQAGIDSIRTPIISASKTEGNFTHAEGTGTKAIGNSSHAEGYYTQSTNQGEHACGKYNLSTKSTDAAKASMFSIGIGTSDTDRANAVEVKQNGDIYIIGVGGYDGTNSDSAQTLQEILANL